MTAENVPFTAGDLVVYPSHGVGKITAIETQEIAGHMLSVFVVTFDKDRMTLRVHRFQTQLIEQRLPQTHTLKFNRVKVTAKPL